MTGEVTIFLTIIQVFILALTAWFSLRRSRFQNVVDDSVAALNYRKMVIELQTEIQETRAQVDVMKEIMESSHLEIELIIEVGGEPIIKKWNWRKIEEPEKIKVASPS